jgi:hypothetical protein
MDAPETLAKMFWKNYKELLGNKAEEWNQITILQDFVIWLELRKTNGCTSSDQVAILGD